MVGESIFSMTENPKKGTCCCETNSVDIEKNFEALSLPQVDFVQCPFETIKVLHPTISYNALFIFSIFHSPGWKITKASFFSNMFGCSCSFPTRKFPFILRTYFFGWSPGYQVDQHLPLDNSGVLLKAKVRAGGHNRSNHPEQDDDGYLARRVPKITGLIRWFYVCIYIYDISTWYMY